MVYDEKPHIPHGADVSFDVIHRRRAVVYDEISLLQNSHGPRDIRPVLLLRRGDPAHDVSVVQSCHSRNTASPELVSAHFKTFVDDFFAGRGNGIRNGKPYDRLAYTGTRRQRDNAGFDQAAAEDRIKLGEPGR